MKNLTLVTALIFTIIFSSQAQKENSSNKILPSTQNSFKIIYTKSGDSNVKIKLLDDKGSFIRMDKVASNDGFMKRYDLSQLSPGTYTFEVSDKSNKSFHEVTVSQDSDLSVIVALGNETSVTTSVSTIPSILTIEAAQASVSH